MADINSLTAYRAIVDNEGKPLPEFLLMWQRLLELVDATTTNAAFHAFATNQQSVNVASIYTAGLANVHANSLAATAGGTVRSGLKVQWITTNGATWVGAGSVSLATVSAGDLHVSASGPLLAADANGVTTGEYRVLEGVTTVFTGTWTADGDGVSWSLVSNETIGSTLASIARVTTGSLTYAIEYRVLSGPDLDLFSYLYAERS